MPQLAAWRIIDRLMRLVVLFLAVLALGPVRAELPPLPSLAPTTGNQVEAVFGLEPLLTRLEADLKAARRSAYLDFYVLGGALGSRVANVLVERHRAGVDVRVMMDRNRGTLPKLKREVREVVAILTAAGVPVRWAVSRPGGVVLHRWTEDHNKLAIIDGRVSWCGGANISDTFARFFDLMMRVDGPASEKLEALFRHDWAAAALPELPSLVDQTYPATGLLEAAPGPGATVRVVSTGIGRRSFEGSLLNAIRSARRQILVQQHQFGWDPALDELIRAHRRGVEVRVLVDPCDVDNFVPVFHQGPQALFNAHAVVKLQKAGVPVRAVKVESAFDAYHMKLGVFDRTMLLVGSANWERLSVATATESVLEISGGTAPDAVSRWHDRVWTEQSEPPKAGWLAHALHHLIGLYL
jgi:phosphatidylserine/phosphatidylglycerophosphate/cardiolipin synthase-like enzyme